MHRDIEMERKPHVSFHSLGAIFTSPSALKRISLRVFFFIPRAHAERADSAASVRVRVGVGALPMTHCSRG